MADIVALILAVIAAIAGPESPASPGALGCEAAGWLPVGHGSVACRASARAVLISRTARVRRIMVHFLSMLIPASTRPPG